jgi:methyl-accepting chemotaxis protein
MRLTVGRKLSLAFGSILTLMIVSTILCSIQSANIKHNQDLILNTCVPTLVTARSLQRDLNQSASKARQGMLAGPNAARRQESKKLFDDAWDAIEKDVARMDQLEAGWVVPANRDRLAQVKIQLPKFHALGDRGIEQAAAGVRDVDSDESISVNDAIKAALGDMADSFEKQLRDTQEALVEANRSLNLTLAVTSFLALGFGISIAIFLARSISTSTAAVLGQAEAIAAGDLTHDDLEVRSQDELGDLTTAINKMSDSLKTMIVSIRSTALHVASASEELHSTSQQISANSEETSAQADVVSKAAQTVSQNLQTVATGAEEMGASIKEIAKNATEAAKVATGAVKVAEATTATVSKLGDSSTEIGQVIKVITSIAQQTNLLALNATIEAARAGEAGKGFAVVANEVKELAKETAKATEDISRKIEAIQADTKAAVDAIASISGVINQINDISGTIATAVEEQNATTNEMSRNVSEAAQGSGEITSNIAGVAEAAQGATRGANDTQKASQQLVETSNQLRQLVERFKIGDANHERGQRAAESGRQKMAAYAGS